MKPLDAGIGEFQKTIMDLSARLATLASMVAELQNEKAELLKEIEALKKPAA
jgi:peptidoglycan hydrolase CwlO-like protein